MKNEYESTRRFLSQVQHELPNIIDYDLFDMLDEAFDGAAASVDHDAAMMRRRSFTQRKLATTKVNDVCMNQVDMMRMVSGVKQEKDSGVNCPGTVMLLIISNVT
jgi:hypothetical protein